TSSSFLLSGEVRTENKCLSQGLSQLVEDAHAQKKFCLCAGCFSHVELTFLTVGIMQCSTVIRTSARVGQGQVILHSMSLWIVRHATPLARPLIQPCFA